MIDEIKRDLRDLESDIKRAEKIIKFPPSSFSFDDVVELVGIVEDMINNFYYLKDSLSGLLKEEEDENDWVYREIRV